MTVSEEQFHLLLRLPDAIPTRVGRLMDKYEGHPLLGSPATREVLLYPETDTGYAIASQSLTTSADHLFALERVLTSPMMTFAPWTLSRASLEASCLCRWLIDPQIDGKTRAARTLNVRLQNLHDELAYVAALEKTHAGEDFERVREQVRGRQEGLVATAEGLGIRVMRERNSDRVTGFGTALGRITDILRHFGMEDEFRLYSGVAHSRYWATLHAGFEQVGPNRRCRRRTVRSLQ